MWGEVRQRARSWNASNMCIAKSVSRLIGLDLLLVSFSTHWHLNAVHSTRSTRYCVPGFSLLPQLNYYGIDCNLQRALLFILRAHDSFCASDSRLFVVCVCAFFIIILLPFPYCFVYSFLSFHSEAFDSLWSIKSEKIELSNLSILYDLKIQPEKRMAVYCSAYNSSTELIIYIVHNQQSICANRDRCNGMKATGIQIQSCNCNWKWLVIRFDLNSHICMM